MLNIHNGLFLKPLITVNEIILFMSPIYSLFYFPPLYLGTYGSMESWSTTLRTEHIAPLAAVPASAALMG